jgi:carbonic anhydrase/acetyltransferase-like protein (isoleucine patch superfamily)
MTERAANRWADVFVAPSAVVVGDVRLGAGVGVWHQAVLRGDLAPIVVGAGTNIQDGAILHVAPDRPCLVGERVTIGHRVVLHGCTLEDDVLVGIGAIVLNGAVVGSGAVIGAGAVVTEGMMVAPGTLVVGVPARVVGPVDDELARRARTTAERYVERGRAARLELEAT